VQNKNAEEITKKGYENAVRDILLTIFRTDNQISQEFYKMSIEEQKEFEKKIEESAKKVSSILFDKLKEKKLIGKQIDDETLKKLILESIQESKEK
jgi:hypothetical protein